MQFIIIMVLVPLNCILVLVEMGNEWNNQLRINSALLIDYIYLRAIDVNLNSVLGRKAVKQHHIASECFNFEYFRLSET